MGPSKGIQAYYYSAVEGCQVKFTVPGKSIQRKQTRAWSNDHLEVDKDNLDGFFNVTGRFIFSVTDVHGVELANQWVEVNVITGMLGDGTMNSIEQMRTITKNGIMIAYGFYAAGNGDFGLPSAHQCHVTVSHEQSDWMGQVAPRGSPSADQMVSCFALPCAHDPGMSTMQNVDAVLNGGAGRAFSQLLASELKIDLNLNSADGLLPTNYIREVVYCLSITQKDSVATMLQLGARYFEFRPGKLPKNLTGLSDQNYFLHLVIPGLAYDAFLDTLLDFLGSHPDEVVVVQLRHDGIPDFVPKFDDGAMDAVAQAAVTRRNNGVQVGNANDLRQGTIRQLREANKRLLITKQDHVSQYSSYDDAANATLQPGPIVQRFASMSAGVQTANNPTFTILQCQATATNIPNVLKFSVVTSSADTSVMMATKAACDTGTHPWIQAHGASFLSDHCLIIMDDWIDGATCDIAIELSKQRFQARTK